MAYQRVLALRPHTGMKSFYYKALLLVAVAELTTATLARLTYYTASPLFVRYAREVENSLVVGTLVAFFITSAAIAPLLLNLVQTGRLSWIWSTIMFFVAALALVMLYSTLMLVLAGQFGEHLFWGDSGFFIIYAFAAMLVLAVGQILVFAACAFRRKAGTSFTT